ncbi:MAG TPA: RidA family protein [Xanthobacteraceae bacterium]|nr:RidA family protein [Xanthobacteraceae bacterium]
MNPEAKLHELGLALPSVPTPAANFVPFKRDGHVIYLSGQGPRKPDGSLHVGKVGRDVSVEEAYEHAKLVGLGLLAVAKRAAGGLDKVEVLKLFGMVNAVPEFTEQPKVINGCSDLLVAVLGERGRHARSAIGVGSLPNGMTVEIEAVMRVVA